MGRRRKAREVALQFLYQLDQHGDTDPTAHEAEFWARHPVDEQTRGRTVGPRAPGRRDAVSSRSSDTADSKRFRKSNGRAGDPAGHIGNAATGDCAAAGSSGALSAGTRTAGGRGLCARPGDVLIHIDEGRGNCRDESDHRSP